MADDALTADEQDAFNRVVSGELEIPPDLLRPPASRQGRVSDLPGIIAQLESGGGRDIASQPPTMVDPTYGQYRGFADQYGSGPAGVNKFAQAELAAKPTATLGDYYADYVLGTGAPGRHTAAELASTSVPGAQGAYGNMMRNAGVPASTPLASLVNSANENPASERGLMQLAAAPGPGGATRPPAPVPADAPLTPEEEAQFNEVASGKTRIGLLPGVTNEQALANPAPSMVTSDPATLGIKPGARPSYDPAKVSAAMLWAGTAGMPTEGYRTILEKIAGGQMEYTYPDGHTEWHVQPGGLLDPKRAEYSTLLQAHAQATGELVPATIMTPYGRADVQIPKDQYLDFKHKHPDLQLAPGAAEPGAPGAAPAAGGAPSGPAAAAGPPAAGVPAIPGGAAAPAPGAAVVTQGAEGPVITPPPAQPVPQGQTGQPVLPPGADPGGVIKGDQARKAQLEDEAAFARKFQVQAQGVLDALKSVKTGKLGPYAGQVASWLKGWGVDPDVVTYLTGTDAPQGEYLVKLLFQQAAASAAASGHGLGLMNMFTTDLPSTATQADTIKMYENAVNMQAQRAIDNRDQGVAYFNKAHSDYAAGRDREYHPLSEFQQAFDQTRPDINYYRAAQIMSPGGFAKEGHEAAAATGTTDQILRLIPRGSTFTDTNGNPTRRDAKGDIVPVQPAATAAPAGGAGAPIPPGPAPGGAAAAPVPPAAGGGISPQTIQTLKGSGMSDADIARIQGAPAPSAGGVPQGAVLVPGRRAKSTGAPVYQLPNGTFWTP